MNVRNGTSFFKSLFSNEEGQTLIEYAFVVFLIAIVTVAALTLFGVNVSTLFNSMANAL